MTFQWFLCRTMSPRCPLCTTCVLPSCFQPAPRGPLCWCGASLAASPPWYQSSAPYPASFHPQHLPEQLPAAHSLGGRKDVLSTKTAAAHHAAARSGRILTWPRTTTPRRQHGDPPNPPPILPIPLPSPRLPGDHRDAHGAGLSSSPPSATTSSSAVVAREPWSIGRPLLLQPLLPAFVQLHPSSGSSR